MNRVQKKIVILLFCVIENFITCNSTSTWIPGSCASLNYHGPNPDRLTKFVFSKTIKEA